MNIFIIVSVSCLALCFVMFLYFRWYIKKRTTSAGLLASELDERQTEVAKLIAEIDRITDRDSQLVEDRVTKLKTLLQDVDKRIELYEKEIEQLQLQSKNDLSKKPNETLYTSLGRGIHAALKSPSEEEKEKPKPPSTVEQLFLERQIREAAPVIEKKEPAKIEVKEKAPKPPTKKQIRAAIDQLLNEGLSAEEIASRLEISLPEVNLAMKLRRK